MGSRVVLGVLMSVTLKQAAMDGRKHLGVDLHRPRGVFVRLTRGT